eukprot:Sspe_Gene.59645::Locus_32772_Transcript_2_3_Confidence_0.714_Length_595::g.59645::m.59645
MDCPAARGHLGSCNRLLPHPHRDWGPVGSVHCGSRLQGVVRPSVWPVLAFAVGYTLYTMMLLATFALGASCGALTTLCIIWSKGMVESTAANTTAVVLSSAVLGLLTVRFQRCMVIYLTAV